MAKPDDFATLALRYMDRLTTPAEEAQLKAELQGSPAQREIFVALARQRGELGELMAEEAVRAAAPKRSDTRRISSRRIAIVTPRRSPWGPLAFAAVILVGAIALLAHRTPRPQTPKETEEVQNVVPKAPPPPVARHEPKALPEKERPLPAPEKPVAEKPRETPKETVVVPKPETKDTEPKPPAPPRETVAVVAVLEAVQGEVYVLGLSKTPAREGQDLASTQGIQTVGAESLATVKYIDASRLEVGADSMVREIGERQAYLLQGRLTADGAASSAPVALTTPHVEAVSTDSRLTLTCAALSTQVEVERGRAQLTRLSDTARVSVDAGFFVVAGDGIDFSPKPVAAQGKGGWSQERIDAAIRRGITYLRTRMPNLPVHDGTTEELVLWTFVHAGIPESDPDFKRMLKNMLGRDLASTYDVSLQAMILEELERVHYQGRIFQCAQFLVENQCANGQWTYGQKVPLDKAPTDVATTTPRKDAASGPKSARQKPPVARTLQIKKKTRDGGPSGDNSNSQYAALGLRACHDAGVLVPEEVIRRAADGWRKSQQGTEEKDPARGGTATGGNAYFPPRGWSYGDQTHPGGPYTSMTAGAIGALVIYDYILKQNWKADPAVGAGLQWLTNNFDVTRNVGVQNCIGTSEAWMQYYGLYGLERGCILYGTEKLGAHDWYREGALVILGDQKGDGSWCCRDITMYAGETTRVWDTCFAILFLKRATRPLHDVATGDGRSQPRDVPDDSRKVQEPQKK